MILIIVHFITALISMENQLLKKSPNLLLFIVIETHVMHLYTYKVHVIHCPTIWINLLYINIKNE